MTLNEREAFEEALSKHNIHNVHLCTVFDFEKNEYFPSDFCDPSEDQIVDSINLSWKMWQEKAKAQAVPEQINEIQSWIAVQSTQAMELDGEEFVVGANELAEFIEQLVKSESGAEG